MKSPQIMINWLDQKVWCETCGHWIDGKDLRVTGHHEMPNVDGKSTHRVWERD